jgi:hypothetical protein
MDLVMVLDELHASDRRRDAHLIRPRDAFEFGRP